MHNINHPDANGWQRRRERISLDIERVALELFAECGPEEVTIEQIAVAAGISTRTFFRYFATRDDVLTAFPRRSLERVSQLVRSRPPSESVLTAFMAAEQALTMDQSEREVVLLWGIVYERSPVAAIKALASSAVRTSDTYHQLVAERNRIPSDDPRAGAMGSAIAGALGYAFDRWVRLRGTIPMGQVIVEALTVLKDLDKAPDSFTESPMPSYPPATRPRDPSPSRPRQTKEIGTS